MSGDQDLLERATRALREATPPTQDELADRRARLLDAQRKVQKSSRARTLRWVLPLAAMLAAGSAFAAVPEQFERIARAVGELLAPTAPQLASSQKKPSRTAVGPQQAVGPLPAPTPQPTPPVLPAAPEAPATPSADTVALDDAEQSARAARRRRRAERSTAQVATPEADSASVPAPQAVPEPAPVPAADGDLGLYREAHRQHFRLRDFSAALRGWDAYLAAYPAGTFAVEARYNRAICLVRLDRKADAKKALTPFARGEVAHGYRQAEATKLLEALE
jgi:hypothetical protein